MATLKRKSGDGNPRVALKKSLPVDLINTNNIEAPSDDIHKTVLESNNQYPNRGIILKEIQEVTNDPAVSNLLTHHIVTKGSRARIITNRLTSYMVQADQVNVPDTKRSTELNSIDRSVNNPIKAARNKSVLAKDEGNPSSDGTTLTLKPRKSMGGLELEVIPVTNNTRTQSTINDNKIHLVNISAKPYVSLTVQGMPSEIELSPESTWSQVKSIGRNNPFYVYTGSEDTVSFDITWYSDNKDDRESVITKCKLLESWTKANGYSSSPPIIEIVWGKSEIFLGQSFILYSAKYKLSNFQNSFRHSRKGSVIDGKLLPNVATQTLVFKKVTSGNTTNDDIINKSKLLKTPGIK